jgi:exopolysaccharide biosynthesis protein
MSVNSKGDSAIKIWIYVLVFLIFVVLLLLVWGIPSWTKYHVQKENFKIERMESQTFSKKKVLLSQDIETYRAEHNSKLKVFEKDFNKTAFEHFAKKYFPDLKVQETNIKKDKTPFKVYSLKATTTSKAPKEFYTFIEALKDYPAIIKVNFPITLISSSTRIKIEFDMTVWTKF